MATLKNEFAGLQLKNPFIVASSELTNTLEKIQLAEKAGAAAVSTKLCFLQVPFWAKPYHKVEDRIIFFSPSGDRMSVEDAQRLVEGAKKTTDIKIIANMMGPSDVEGWGVLAKKLEDAGADMIEMNMSCPNIGLHAKQIGAKQAGGAAGASLGQNAELSEAVSRAASSAVKIPVMAKLTPEGPTALMAEACSKGGVAAVSAINCPQSLPSPDIYNGGRPTYTNTNNMSFAGLCGPAIRPLAYRHIAQIRTKNPDLNIAGGGGLMTWQHCVDMIMYGADVLTFCVLFYLKGFRVIKNLEEGMLKFMEEQGYENIGQMRDLALKYIVTPDKVNYSNCVPKVDQSKCTGCGSCVNMSQCMIFEQGPDKKAVVTREKECYGCGVCYWTCPAKAISMVNEDGTVIDPPKK